jgi:GT2 family glycosyltransferase
LIGVFKNEPDFVGRVIVVDDGARRGLGDLPGVIWVPGKKPFVFARNANIGISMAGSNDVILLNDDAILMTPGGFTLLEQAARQRPNMGLCSAGIYGHVGNENQKVRGFSGVRFEEKRLAFVCVLIPGGIIQEIGSLDERFIGYGYEDDDYCLRVTRAGFSLGVFDGCVVEHDSVPSTFRARRDYPKLITENRLRYEEKWRRVLQ